MQPAPPSSSSPCSDVLQDTNLVSHILSLLLEGLDLTVVEHAHCTGSAASHHCRWALRGCRLGMMRRINTTWYLLLCKNTTSRFRIQSLTVLCKCDPWHSHARPNIDPYDRTVRAAMSGSPWCPDAVLGELHFLQPAHSLSLPSLGNHFSFSRGGGADGQAFPCMDRALPALAGVDTLDIQSLNGLLVVPGGIADDRRPLPPSVRRICVHSVGHTGLLHLEVTLHHRPSFGCLHARACTYALLTYWQVVQRLFRDSQERALTCLTSRDVHRGGMADLGGIEEIEILAPLCARVQRMALTDRLEFHFPRRVGGANHSNSPPILTMSREDARLVDEADTSLRMVAQAILQRRVRRKDMAAVLPQCLPMAGGKASFFQCSSLHPKRACKDLRPFLLIVCRPGPARVPGQPVPRVPGPPWYQEDQAQGLRVHGGAALPDGHEDGPAKAGAPLPPSEPSKLSP